MRDVLRTDAHRIERNFPAFETGEGLRPLLGSIVAAIGDEHDARQRNCSQFLVQEIRRRFQPGALALKIQPIWFFDALGIAVEAIDPYFELVLKPIEKFRGFELLQQLLAAGHLPVILDLHAL